MIRDPNRTGYKIGELAEYFGVSTDTVRFYEKKGLLTAVRDEENNYRQYNREDLIFFGYLVHLRQMGVSLEELQKLCDHASLEDEVACIAKQKIVLEEELKILQDRIALADDYITNFSNALHYMGRISVEMSPPLILERLKGDMKSTMQHFSDLTTVHAPKLTFLFPQACIRPLSEITPAQLTGEERLPDQQALSMPDFEDYRRNPNYARGDFEYLELRKCLRTTVKTITGKDYSALFEAFDQVFRMGYRVAGDAVFRVISFRYYDVAYYDLMIPIE